MNNTFQTYALKFCDTFKFIYLFSLLFRLHTKEEQRFRTFGKSQLKIIFGHMRDEGRDRRLEIIS
jgi:hypothetical protein